MQKLLIGIVIVIYGIWSIRWGLRFVNGRWLFLEQPSRKWMKLLASCVIGLLFGFCYFLYRVIKFFEKGIPCGW